tara:strand:+ start:8418 stop:9692 length:1275 start_codon:yes stop_codon:yes gene_type:complete
MFFFEDFSVLDTLILVTIPIFFAAYFIKNPKLFIVSVLFINLTLSLFSFYVIELGGYITELGQFSFRTNNFILFSLYILFFAASFVFLSNYVFENNFKTTIDKNKISIYSPLNFVIGSIIVFLVLLEYASLLIYGIPVLEGQNKVDVVFDNKIISLIGSTGTYISVFCGIIFTVSKKRFFLVIFILHFLFCILAAQKFSALINNMVFFLSPILVMQNSLRINLRTISIFIIFLAVVIGVFYNAYNVDNAFTRELELPTWLAMGYRAFFLSAHAQWAVFEIYFSQGLPKIDLGNFINFHKFLVDQLHPMDTSSSLDKGVTFGMIYPTYLLYTLPMFVHPIAVIIFAALMAYVFEAYIWAVKSNRIILACIVSVILNILIRIFITGNFSLLMSGTTIFAIVLILIYMLIQKINLKSRKWGSGGEYS